MSTTNELTTGISIRFKDIDAMGHVNNALYFTYFEEARKSFLKRYLIYLIHLNIHLYWQKYLVIISNRLN